jgi:hypothetical protein
MAAIQAQVEQLDLRTLLRNPHVAKLTEKYQFALEKSVEDDRTIRKLEAEIHKLRQQVEASQHQGHFSPRYVSLFSCRDISNIRISLDHRMTDAEVATGSPRDHSLTSRTSVPQSYGSQAAQVPEAQIASRPACRPDGLSPAVLWSLEDCKDDPEVRVTKQNRSRLAMHRVLRTRDGVRIPTAEWKEIRATVRLMKDRLAALPDKPAFHVRGKVKGKSYYRAAYPKEWKECLDTLEDRHPVLKLCSESLRWKANHLLGNSLLSHSSKPSSTEIHYLNDRDASVSESTGTGDHSAEEFGIAEPAERPSRERISSAPSSARPSKPALAQPVVNSAGKRHPSKRKSISDTQYACTKPSQLDKPTADVSRAVQVPPIPGTRHNMSPRMAK